MTTMREQNELIIQTLKDMLSAANQNCWWLVYDKEKHLRSLIREKREELAKRKVYVK